MGWLRRRDEPLHEQLARDGGLADDVFSDSDEANEEDEEESVFDANREVAGVDAVLEDAADAEVTAGDDRFEAPNEPGARDGLPPLPPPLSTRPRLSFEWDAVTSVHAPGIASDWVRFVVLADQSWMRVDRGSDEELDALVDAAADAAAPPLDCEAVKHRDDIWAVGARRVRVETIPGLDGDLVVATGRAGQLSVEVDGQPYAEEVPALDRVAGESEGYILIEGAWLVDDLWELRVTPR